MSAPAPGSPFPTRPDPVAASIGRPGMLPPTVEHDLPGSALRRTFRAGRTDPGGFGVGFRSIVDLALRAVDGHVCVSAADGDDLRFVPTSTGWLCTAGPLHDLAASTVGWSLVLDRRTCVEFDLSGAPRAWRSSNSHVDTVVDRRGRIVALRDRTTRRRVHLDWDGARVVQVATDDGATASYTYGLEGTDAGRLLRVVRPDGVITYRWGNGGVRRHHRAS